MTTSRRDFLAALAAGSGAILMGRGWYKQGSGLIVPDQQITRGFISKAVWRDSLANISGSSYDIWARIHPDLVSGWLAG